MINFEETFYMFSLENGVEVMDLIISEENQSTIIDGCPFIMNPLVGETYAFNAEDFADGPYMFIGSTDPYELRSYIMGLFVTL
ncbi:MAG: hypothetical protein WC175_01200 [Candidatus Dojkabacteria bacterium]